MKKNLPDIIRENNDLQQALLKQKGGIVSYLAGHLDADGLEALYEGYRAQCMEVYRDEHKWSMWEEMMERDALGDDHIRKELAYKLALEPVLLGFPYAEDPALSFIDNYLNFAFKKSHTELYPTNVVPDQEFYEEVIIQYIDTVFGRAHLCLWRVLNEHRGKAKAEKDETELWIEFVLQQYARVYINGEEKLRRAVKELIDEKTRDKSKEDCRQICRKEAKDVMRRLWPFARMVNGDDDLVKVPDKEDAHICSIWSSKDLKLQGIDVSIVGKLKKHITHEEMAWLRGGIMTTPLQKCFHNYYNVLEIIGNIWAAQLQKYGIDIRELEEETGCILNKRGFYVEHSLGGLFGKFCEIKHMDRKDDFETKYKAIMEYVGRLKIVVKDEYASFYDKMWDEILCLERVKCKVYDEKHLPEGCIFKRNLVANIIHLMLEKGIFKLGIKVPQITLQLEPYSDRGKNHAVKEPLKQVPDDKELKTDVIKVIEKYLNRVE